MYKVRWDVERNPESWRGGESLFRSVGMLPAFWTLTEML
jgi:hypothetical protein